MVKDTDNRLTIVIIAKNESEMIEDCIKSASDLKPAKILVIDDSSTDETSKKAQILGAQVIKHEKRDFSEIRNFARAYVKTEWVLYLDADERLSQGFSTELKKALTISSCSAYSLPRVNYYLGKKWPYQEKINRLFRIEKLKTWYGEVHETAIVNGLVCSFSHPLIHFTHRNLTEMVDNTISWSEIEARIRFNSHHPPVYRWRLPRVMLTTFIDYYIRQGGWQIGSVGLIESIYQAFSIFVTYARLWELQNIRVAINY